MEKETLWTKFTEWLYYSVWKFGIQDRYYKIRNRLFKKYYLIDTKLPRDSWLDSDSKILYGMMNILVDYVEKEDALNFINWDATEDHKKVKEEIVAIKSWWENYENRQKEIEQALDDWYEERIGGENDDPIKCINKTPTKKEINLHEHLNSLEKKLNEEEEEMLIRLIKIRNYLWT
jgi:hypothetical protein